MMERRMRLFVVVGALWLGTVAATAEAQDWAKAMFDHTSHDFGMVARGAKVEHVFTMENIYLEDARIASVRSTCGCTTPEYPRGIIKTYEKAAIVARVDTRSFVGRKEATLTVTLDKPFPAEVQLQIHCYIRSDVVFEPGSVNFNSVLQGTPVRKRVKVSYAGRNDWRILSAYCRNPHIEASVSELGRYAGQVTYELVVTLRPDAPVGYIKEEIVLATNDPRPDAQRVPLAVEGVVLPAVALRPTRLAFGELQPGQIVTQKLVVQGQSPFRILDAKGPDARFRFVLPETARTVHVIPITFTAADPAGALSGEVRIETDLPGHPVLSVPIDGRVVGPGIPKAAEPMPGANPVETSPVVGPPSQPASPPLPAAGPGGVAPDDGAGLPMNPVPSGPQPGGSSPAGLPVPGRHQTPQGPPVDGWHPAGAAARSEAGE